MTPDPTLRLPRPTPPPDRLEGPGDLLSITERATGRGVVLHSGRIVVVGTEVGGVQRAAADGLSLFDDMRIGTPPASNLRISSRGMQREIVGSGISRIETTVLPERLPAVLIQWDSTPAQTRSGLSLSFAIDRVLTYHGIGGVLRADQSSGDEHSRVCLVCATPTPEMVELVEASGRLEVSLGFPPAAERIRLLFGSGADLEQAEACLAACARGRPHELRAEGALRELRDQAVSVDTGSPDLDRGVEWAKARLDRPAVELVGARRAQTPSDFDPSRPSLATIRPALAVLGHLATGLHERARELTSILVPPGTPLQEPTQILPVAWLSAWTGDASAWSPDPSFIHRAAASCEGRMPAGPRGVLWREALHALADLADAARDEEAARRCRAAAEATPRPERGPALQDAHGESLSRSALTLPVVGRTPRPATTSFDDEARLIAFAFGDPLEARSLPESWQERPHHPLLGWAGFAAGEAELGLRALRTHVQRGFEEITGAWPRTEPEGLHAIETRTPCEAPDDPVLAALVPITFVLGLLGIRPDAPFGRVRLGPTLPGDWSAASVRRIRVGDATFDFDYAQEDGARRFRLLPTGGRTPSTIIFEPAVLGRVGRVLVDDTDADVAIESTEDGRSRVRLQLPLDRPRTVVLL